MLGEYERELPKETVGIAAVVLAHPPVVTIFSTSLGSCSVCDPFLGKQPTTFPHSSLEMEDGKLQ
jgi:hypothetical protein